MKEWVVYNFTLNGLFTIVSRNAWFAIQMSRRISISCDTFISYYWVILRLNCKLTGIITDKHNYKYLITAKTFSCCRNGFDSGSITIHFCLFYIEYIWSEPPMRWKTKGSNHWDVETVAEPSEEVEIIGFYCHQMHVFLCVQGTKGNEWTILAIWY